MSDHREDEDVEMEDIECIEIENHFRCDCCGNMSHKGYTLNVDEEGNIDEDGEDIVWLCDNCFIHLSYDNQCNDYEDEENTYDTKCLCECCKKVARLGYAKDDILICKKCLVFKKYIYKPD